MSLERRWLWHLRWAWASTTDSWHMDSLDDRAFPLLAGLYKCGTRAELPWTTEDSWVMPSLVLLLHTAQDSIQILFYANVDKYFKIVVPIIQSILDHKLNMWCKLVFQCPQIMGLTLIIIIVMILINNHYLLTSSLVTHEKIWSKNSGFKTHEFKLKFWYLLSI